MADVTNTVFQLIIKVAQSNANQPALLDTNGFRINYGSLSNNIASVHATLRSQGIHRNHRAAIVIPNGIEMALTYLGVVCSATAAPLNPDYKEEELLFYLNDLKAQLVILPERSRSPARSVADKLGIPVYQVGLGDNNTINLQGPPVGEASPDGWAQSEDIALILHTSGTTSRPKMVPLLQRNLSTSAINILDTLQLTPDDRCLNIMPLFHIHGLMAALLASMASGGSVVCSNGFDAARFFDWMAEYSPTWYTAVPTMHQAILNRVNENREAIAKTPLRFVRSSSSSLPPQVMAALENAFSAPVIEAYGMTEAAHQMASNPLPPATRKSGSVGPPAGPEVRIMHEDGPDFMPQGLTGEIVIRGANVTPGYLENPEANEAAYSNGWFRTGDLGIIDPDGFLTISGRRKEIINRGGEKISPREVDEALLSHPSVQQAVAFSIPDKYLGEEVGAAVILRSGEEVTENALQNYLTSRLVTYKIPRRIIFLEEIPKGPTGKLQRVGLADKLGLEAPDTQAIRMPAERADRELEEFIAGLWCEVLGLSSVQPDQRFLELGGSSLQAMRLVSRIQAFLEIDLTIVDFFNQPTIAHQASVVQDKLLAQYEDSEE